MSNGNTDLRKYVTEQLTHAVSMLTTGSASKNSIASAEFQAEARVLLIVLKYIDKEAI